MKKAKKTLLQTILVALVFVGSFWIISTPALAQTTDSGGADHNTGASTSQLKCSVLPQQICNQSNTANAQGGGTFALLTWVLKIMIAVVGVAAVGGMVWAGILYTSAGDNEGQVKQAKTVIVDVVIGLVAFGLMYLVLNWLIPGGVFG